MGGAEEEDERTDKNKNTDQKEGEEDSGSESESESESLSKSITQDVTKPLPDPSTSKLKLKRPAPPPPPQVPDPNNNKKPKKKKNDAQEDSPVKKHFFKRLWSEEDEVVILNAIPLFGADPFSDINSFHNSIKSSLHVDVTNVQLADKLRKLKKKCVKNQLKQENGKPFSTPHEELCFSLSKNIWGENTKTTNLPKAAKKVDPGPTNVDSDFKQFFSVASHGPLLHSADQVIKNGWKHVSASKRSEWENKSDKLMVDQVDLYSRILGLMHEQAKLVSEALKSAQE